MKRGCKQLWINTYTPKISIFQPTLYPKRNLPRTCTDETPAVLQTLWKTEQQRSTKQQKCQRMRTNVLLQAVKAKPEHFVPFPRQQTVSTHGWCPSVTGSLMTLIKSCQFALHISLWTVSQTLDNNEAASPYVWSWRVQQFQRYRHHNHNLEEARLL